MVQGDHLCQQLHFVDIIDVSEGEVFLGNEEMRVAQTAGANVRGGATKKREISRTSLPINVHF